MGYTHNMFQNIYNIVISGFVIPILMTVFGFLTIRNIKLSRQRVSARFSINVIMLNQQPRRSSTKSREYEIAIMILVQIGIYLITSVPSSIYLVYTTCTMALQKSNTQLAFDQFYSNIAFALNSINFCATFYIYVLTTRLFRKDLKQFLSEKRLLKIFLNTQ